MLRPRSFDGIGSYIRAVTLTGPMSRMTLAVGQYAHMWMLLQLSLGSIIACNLWKKVYNCG